MVTRSLSDELEGVDDSGWSPCGVVPDGKRIRENDGNGLKS